MGHAERFTPAATSSAQARSSAATTAEHRDHMAATADDSHGTAFSRTTVAPVFMGKATSEIKCKAPDKIKLDWEQLAHSLGMTGSALLLSTVMVRLYGVGEVERMHSNQLRAAAGIGPDWAPTAEPQQ